MDYKPLLTPLAIIPFFIHYTQDFTRAQRRRTIGITSFSAFVVIATSALLGLQILDFFGISLASFQVGGGMLLLTSALTVFCAGAADCALPDQSGSEPDFVRLVVATERLLS